MTTTLLAVDDSKTMRKVLEITFAGEDYKVVLAENSQQALELLRSERPSVALVDAALGSESGYELCRSIKNESPGTGVIILSSKHAPYDKGRGSSAGADDFMDKPFDTQQLLDKTGGVARKAVEAPVAPPKPAPSPIAPVVAPPVSAPASMARTQAYGGAPAAPKPVAPAPAARPPVTAPAPAAPAARPAAAPVPVAAAAATSGNGALAGKLADMGLSPQQVEGVLALSREVVEQVVWEVVPQLAETIIQEEIRRLTAE